MTIRYDAEVDALSINFLETTVTTHHITEGITVEYDTEGHIAGIEILDAVRRFGSPDTLRQVVLEKIGIAA